LENANYLPKFSTRGKSPRGAIMGNRNSTRWGSHTKKRTVEECRQISAREAKHIGIATTATPVANSAARRLWALCPQCGARVWYLYQAPDSEMWSCRQCHGLAYKSAQQRGTYAAFDEWLNQERWREYADRHASHDWLLDKAFQSWNKLCAPYDLRAMNPDEKLTLIMSMGSAEKVQRMYQHQLDKWTAIRDRLEERAARWAMKDLQAEWKQRHRSKGKCRKAL
jgi:enoyl-CoA hydratase/carnithine racemase